MTRKFRSYTVDGVEYPSVTSVCGLLDKGEGLLRWAAKLGWEEASRVRESSASRGSAIHAYAAKALLRMGDKIELAQENRGYALALEKFLLEWNGEPLTLHKKGSKKPLPILEHKVFSKRWGYAGTLDCILTFPLDEGPTILVDWKTSSSFHDEYAFQTAAYLVAFNEMYGLSITNRMVVRLQPDGSYEVRQYDNLVSDFSAFCGLLEVAKWYTHLGGSKR